LNLTELAQGRIVPPAEFVLYVEIAFAMPQNHQAIRLRHKLGAEREEVVLWLVQNPRNNYCTLYYV